MNQKTTSTPNRKLGFTALFLIEMWERFGFYGMQILIVVFLKIFLGFSDTHALLTWGAFAAMIYTTPIIGGWIGDRVLGTRRTTMLGAIVLAIGYLLLALPMPNWFIFFAFGVIASGNGLFKANPNNLLSQLYEDDKAALDGAFTLYYMSINIGALASQILTPIVRVRWGWHLAFGVSFIGLLIGITNFFFMKKYLNHVGSKPDFEPLSVLRLIAVIVGTFVVSVIIALVVFNVFVAQIIVFVALAGLIGLFGYLILTESEGASKGFIATFILTLQGLVFFVFYQQMSTSLTLFALRNVHLNFYGYQIPPEQFQVLNPFWIFILSPILAWIYNKLGEQDNDLSIATKFSFGFVMLAIGFFIYWVSRYFAYSGMISPWWMIAGYFFQSFGELLISGLGLAMVSRFVAQRWRGIIMGGWLLTTGISQFIGSMVANAASVPDKLSNILKLVPAQHQMTFTQLPAALKQTLSSFDLGAFRYWLAGSPTSQSALQNASNALQEKFQGFSTTIQHSLQTMPTFNSLPPGTQHNLLQLNQDFYHATLPLYTNLFLILGCVAVGAAIISFALNPYLKRLEAEHDALTSGTKGGDANDID
jgi:POT family proton-dependent oligopeptide transporter